MRYSSTAYDQVMDGLKWAPSLRIVTVPWDLSSESMLRTIGENLSLEEIRLILPPPRNSGVDYTTYYKHLDPRVRALIVFQPDPSSAIPTDRSQTHLLANSPPNISPSSDPLFVPMA
jgi:hypothetical protein